MDERVTRRQLFGAGASVLGVGIVVAGCSGDSEPAGSAATDTAATSTTTGTTAMDTTATTARTADTAADGTDTVAAGPTTAGADETTPSGGTPSATAFTVADFAALGTCLVLPELTAGPFPSIAQLERRDITEGIDGHPLRLGIQVVDETCTPIPGAKVEIWHCDVDGDYSAYRDGATTDDAGEGTTFYRGYQTANADGIVEFHTRYPGWYRGRAIHIHSKVHLDDTTVLTTQYLFDDALNEAIMAEGVYAAHGPPDTTNDQDGVTSGMADTSGLIMTASDDADIGGTRALIVVGVDPSAAR